MERQGLSTEEARRRFALYGPNEVERRERLSSVAAFVAKFKNPLILILIASAALSFFFGNEVNALIIIVMVLLSTVLDFINTHRSQRAADALRKRVMVTATVLRDGRYSEIPIREIVPGDVVSLTPGDLIPADGIVWETDDFFVSESSLTGESFPQERRDGEKVSMGGSVVSGTAIEEVVATGKETAFGRIAERLAKREEVTEFERGIRRFSLLIAKTTFLLVLAVFVINAFFRHSFLDSFLFALALAVGLTPELLPVIIAFNLAKGSLQMAKRGVIVKRTSAIEDFGSMDILCTDKTGTLTEDHITLVKYLDGAGEQSEEVLRLAYLSSIYQSGLKNPLDTAIVEFRRFDVAPYRKIDEIPFDFSRRRESIVVERDGHRILVTKGAPEEVLEVSSSYGSLPRPLDRALRDTIEETYRRLSEDGFRVLGIATKTFATIQDRYEKDEECDMTFLGFVAFLDPPKSGVRETLRQLEEEGIEIKILTGDNDLVTKKVAHELGLPIKGVILGGELGKLSDEELQSRAEETTIFARVTPDEKLRIVNVLRRSGHVVGYLGDGINDAPSLRAADVGVSVQNAVDVARESADLILLKKSLHALTNGVLEGRRTFVNTFKYLMMALSSNFGNMFSMAAASLFLPFLPMLPTQILLNNFLYDTAQFALPLDTVDADSLRRPQKMDIAFLKRFMVFFGSLSSFFDFLTFGTLLFLLRFSESVFQTGWFLESLATQTLVIFIVRSRLSVLKARRPSIPLILNIFAVVALGWAIVFSPLGRYFSFTVPQPALIGAILAIVAAYLFAVELFKRRFFRASGEPS